MRRPYSPISLDHSTKLTFRLDRFTEVRSEGRKYGGGTHCFLIPGLGVGILLPQERMMDFWSLGLTIAIVLLAGALVYSWRKTRQGSSNPSTASSGSIPVRKNVLILMFVAYGALLGVFGIMVAVGVDAEDAYDLIGVPFVALIGGTLAVAKDLIE